MRGSTMRVAAAEGVEGQPVRRAVHERRSRHQAGPAVAGVLDDGRRGRATRRRCRAAGRPWRPGRCRPGARARPWACPSCRRCRGCRGRRGRARPAGGSADAEARASSYQVAPGSRPLPESSATWSSTSRFGRSPRTSSSVGANAEWKMIALGPAVVQQVPQLLGDVAVVHVERGDAGACTRRASPRGTRCRCAGRGRGGPGRTPSPRARIVPGARRTRWLPGGWPGAGCAR